MYTQVNNSINCSIGYSRILPILNRNIIKEEKKKEAIQAMGLAACQAKCLRCSHCSANRCGNRS